MVNTFLVSHILLLFKQYMSHQYFRHSKIFLSIADVDLEKQDPVKHL